MPQRKPARRSDLPYSPHQGTVRFLGLPDWPERLQRIVHVLLDPPEPDEPKDDEEQPPPPPPLAA